MPLSSHSLLTSLVILVGLALGGACEDTGQDYNCQDGKCDIGGGDFDLYQAGNRFGWGGKDEFLDEIQPILAKRCVACHGCSDSPCQLKLSSYEGLLRGSNENNIFAPSVTSQDPNRIKDGRHSRTDGTINYPRTADNWRDSDYYSVTQGGDSSLMSKLL